MHEIKNIEMANQSFWLWPPVADAVETMLRRRDDAANYERIWRLIHLWESITTTLSCAYSALILHSDDEHSKLKIRELLYGLKWDENTRSLKSIGLGVFGGSNDKRIQILRLSNGSQTESSFAESLRQFLTSKGLDQNGDSEFQDALLDFRRSWGRVCDAPSDLGKRDHTVLEVIGFINNFRNKFAHVPFPNDVLDEIFSSLERVTENLFGINPLPSQHEQEGISSALTGGLLSKRTLWPGSHRFNAKENSTGLFFTFPLVKNTEKWKSGPFAYVDSSKRPYVLTRLTNADSGTFEYTRFLGEANAIVSAENEGLEALQPPTEVDYSRLETDQSSAEMEEEIEIEVDVPSENEPQDSCEPDAIARTFGEAISRIREKDYDAAIPFLRGHVKKHPNYHVGWSRLGFALREKAASLHFDHSSEAILLLEEACAAFSNATRHSDIEYQANAHYEKSKALLRLFELKNDEDAGHKSWENANRAAVLSPDNKFLTWIEHLGRKLSSDLRSR